MTMAVWNVDRCYGGVEVVVVAAPRILISTHSSRRGRGGWGWSWTTKSIDAELDALDGQQSLKERLGGSAASKYSFSRCFASGFVRNTRAKESDEVSEMGTKTTSEAAQAGAAAGCNSIEPQVCSNGGEQGFHLLLRVHVGTSQRHDSCSCLQPRFCT